MTSTTAGKKAEPQCCPMCGLLNPPEAVLCDCGYNFDLRSGTAKLAVRPWTRYWARMFDIAVFSVPAGFGLALLLPGAFSDSFGGLLLSMALLFSWTFVEALFLSSFGTTPGKWLLGVRLTRKGAPITYSAALSRSIKVWSQGLAAGLPLISLVALAYSYSQLKRDSTTAWDNGAFIVTHVPVGPLRIAFAAVVLLLGFALMVIERSST